MHSNTSSALHKPDYFAVNPVLFRHTHLPPLDGMSFNCLKNSIINTICSRINAALGKAPLPLFPCFI